MNRQQVLRSGAIAGTIVTLMAAVAACSGDRATAPTTSTAPTTMRASRGGASRDTSLSTFVISPGRATKVEIADGHIVQIPADALCDPATSGYGATVWEKACAPATTDVTISAYVTKDALGNPYVRFSPDVRFTPDDAKVTLLYLQDKDEVREPDLTILYCPTGSTRCVDEAAKDSELATQIDRKNGFFYRRIKHFSGYNIASGFSASAEY